MGEERGMNPEDRQRFTSCGENLMMSAMNPKKTLVAAVAATILMAGHGLAEDSPAPAPAKSVLSEEIRALTGRWVRTDYPYVIEMGSVKDDGTLEAAYYNPRPINVGRAVYEESVAGPVVTVELQDANYPGSTYTLTYDRTRDILYGTYFQAVQGQTFAVVFARER